MLWVLVCLLWFWGLGSVQCFCVWWCCCHVLVRSVASSAACSVELLLVCAKAIQACWLVADRFVTTVSARIDASVWYRYPWHASAKDLVRLPVSSSVVAATNNTTEGR